MERQDLFSFMSVVVLLTQLLLPLNAGSPAQPQRHRAAGNAPQLYLGTTSIELTVAMGELGPPAVVEPVFFRNAGTAPLRWEFFFGSQIAGCQVAATIAGLSIAPTAGTLAPRSGTVSDLRVATTGLNAGTQHALLCIATNDPRAAVTGIPVTITVK